MKTKAFSLFLVAIVLILSACRANVSRNNDGSLTMETTVSERELQDVISASIADPLIKEVTVSLQSGYVLVNAERQRLNDAAKTDTMSFRLDLAVSNGQLSASISDALIDGNPIEQDRVDHWNETITSRLLILGKKHPNSAVQSVNVTPEAVSMTWLVSK